MYFDIEKRSAEIAAAVLCVEDSARGPIATAFVRGANEMLSAIERGNYIVEKNNVAEIDLRKMTIEEEIPFDKDMRRQIDDILQMVKAAPASRERSLAITKLQEAVMWLGMDLKRLGTPNPYPSSKDPSTGLVIEPTADGLKM